MFPVLPVDLRKAELSIDHEIGMRRRQVEAPISQDTSVEMLMGRKIRGMVYIHD
jgi:hypothetical protein